MVDEVVWVKMTVHGRLAKSHGYYLQHAKEVRSGLSTLQPVVSGPNSLHVCTLVVIDN